MSIFNSGDRVVYLDDNRQIVSCPGTIVGGDVNSIVVRYDDGVERQYSKNTLHLAKLAHMQKEPGPE